MYRKAKVIWVLIIAMFLLSGCQKKTADDSHSDETATIDFDDIKPSEPEPVIVRDNVESEEAATETTTEIETQTEEITPYCDIENVKYDVKSENFVQGNIDITYPQIIDMQDGELMQQINENIKKAVIPDYLLEDDTCENYTVDYEIATKGTGIVSIVFRGDEYYSGAAHPNNIIKTLNIRLSNGENVRFANYADIEIIVSDLELAQNYTIISDNVDIEDFSAFLNNGYVTDYAMTLLDYDIDFSTETIEAGYSYIKDNHPVLCIFTEHAIGDYVEVYFDNAPIKQ